MSGNERRWPAGPRAPRTGAATGFGAAALLLLGVLLHASGARAGSIFDDDWTPPPPRAEPRLVLHEVAHEPYARPMARPADALSQPGSRLRQAAALLRGG